MILNGLHYLILLLFGRGFKMRKKLHNFIDWIFDTNLKIYRNFIDLKNSIICFFRIPKYKLNKDVYLCWANSSRYAKISKIYKEYKTDIIFYILTDGISYSEGLLDFYKEKVDNRKNILLINKEAKKESKSSKKFTINDLNKMKKEFIKKERS